MTIDEDNELLRKLEPIMSHRAKSLWYWLVLSDKSAVKAKNQSVLRLLGNRHAKVDYREEIRLPPPSPDRLAGEYHLGDVLYPDSAYGTFGLREEDFPKHILVCGITGAGKTNLCFQILKELARHQKPFWVFDWKQSYRKLKGLPEFRDLKIIRIGEPDCAFKFNPLIPPVGINPKHWMTLVVDVIKHVFFVAHGPEYFFRKGLSELYQRFRVYDGNSSYPTFTDLEKLLRKEYVKGREMLWMSSAKRVLAVLTFSGLLGEVLNVREQGDIEELLQGQVVFELDNLATLEKTFVIEVLLLWLFHYRKNEGASRFKHAIVIEEAHHILSSAKEKLTGEEPIIETFIRMIREFGESVIAVDQEPSKLSKSIVANSNCKICFTLGRGGDIRRMAEAMSLKESESGSIDRLRVGKAIVKTKNRFSEAVHVEFPLVEVSGRNMKQQEIE